MLIQFFGDMSFVGELGNNPNSKIFDNVRPLLKEADWNIGNLECVLTNSEDGYEGKCNLKASPEWAKILKENKFNIMNLANNHVMDYKWNGLRDTLEILSKNDILTIGAGVNKNEARKPLILEKEGVKVALLGACQVEISSPVFANGGPGISKFNKEDLLKAVSQIRDKVDYIILIIHWGIEHYHYPSPEQRELARQLTESGIDFIIGHHPHVLQGYEKLNSGYVYYSIGNFLFDDFTWKSKDKQGVEYEHYVNLDTMNRLGGLLRISINKNNTVNCSFFPTYFDKKNGLNILDNNILDKLSKPFHFPGYKIFWIFYSTKMEWKLRISNRFNFRKLIKKIYKIRWRHFRELFQLLKRSVKITGGKSTNPYE